MNERYKKYTIFNMIIALIFVLAAGFTYFYEGKFGWMTIMLAVSAAFFLISWLILNNDILKATVKGRSVKYSTNAVVFALIILLILASAYYIILENNKEIDLTPDKLFSLSGQTVKLLENLDKDVRIVGFFDTKAVGSKQSFEDLIGRYKIYTKKIEVQIIDPYEDPVSVKQFGISKVPTLVFISGTNEKRVYDMKENEFTNAIKSIVSSGKKKVYFVKGHGEKTFESMEAESLSILKQRLESDNYEVESLELIRTGNIPEDATVLVIAGAEKPYMQTELDAIENFIENNGKVIFMLDPDKQLFSEFLGKYGFEFSENVIIDVNPVAQLLGTNYVMPIVSSYRDHDMVEDFDLAVVLNLSMELGKKENGNNDFKISVIAETGEGSWAEKNVKDLFAKQKTQVTFNEGVDAKGPLPVVMIAEKDGEKDTQETDIVPEKSQILVYGDSDLITNRMIDVQGNSDFFLNSVNYLAGDSELISIRVKDIESQPIQITEAQGKALFYLYYLILPVFPMIIYAGVYVNRRRKRV